MESTAVISTASLGSLHCTVNFMVSILHQKIEQKLCGFCLLWGTWMLDNDNFFGNEVCENKRLSMDFHLIASYCFAVKALHLDIFIRLFIVILANMRQKMFLVTGTSLKRLLMDAQKLLRASHSQL